MKTYNYLVVACILLGISVKTEAQTPINVNLKGEKTVTISGTLFSIILNDLDGTAILADNGGFRVDKRNLAIKRERRIKKLGKDRTLIIPSTVSIGNVKYLVTGLGRGVFANYRNVKKVEIPNTITTIENEAFFYSSIKSISFPSSVEYIGSNSFANTSLSSVVIPPEVEHLGDSAFFNSDLEVIEIPSPIAYIGKDTFKKCSKLKSVTLPNPNIPVENLFSNNKDVSVKYVEYGSNVVAKPHKKKKKVTQTPKAEITYATTSDVDVNIPTNVKGNNESFAIIIANEEYEKVAKVDCAHRDGQSFMNYCKNTLGVPDTNIRYIEDATLGNIMEALTWIKNVAQVYAGDAKIIIYYAGHGIPDESNGTAYLLPVDVAANNVNGAYSLGKLYEMLGSLNAKCVTLFLDACFSGSLRGEGMLTSARSVAIEVKEENPQGNMVVFSASKGNETAYPYAEKGHGLFTYFLLKKLQETSGDVDYGTLSDYIRKEVSRRAITINSKPQTPTVVYSPSMSNHWKELKLR